MAPRGATRVACLRCQEAKKTCVPSPDGGPCERCAAKGGECAPPDPALPRRAREKKRRAERWNAWRGAKGGSADGEPREEEAGKGARAARAPGAGARTPSPGTPGDPSTPSDASSASSPAALVGWSRGPGSPSVSFSSAHAALPPNPQNSFRWPPGPPHPGTPQHVPAAVSTGPAGANARLLPALAAYFECYHAMTPLVHRLSFHEAFSGTGSVVYGKMPPLPLMYAMAANGMRYVADPVLSSAERVRMGRFFCERSKDALLAGYFGSGNTGTTDLEAAQVLFLLYIFVTTEQSPASAAVLLERGLEVIRHILSDPLQRLAIMGERAPLDPADWLRTELLIRLYAKFSLYEAAASHLMDRPMGYDFFGTKLVLPVHDGVFNLPAARAFLGFQGPAGATVPWMVADFGAVARNPEDPIAAHRLTTDIFSSVFSRRASHLTAVLFLAYLRSFRQRMRRFVTASGIDTLELASRPAGCPESAAERAYRRQVALFDAMVSASTACIPPELGKPLAAGDPRPLYLAADAYFNGFPHAHAFVCTYISLRAMSIESWISASVPADPPQGFLGSPAFLSTLESAIVVSALARAQLAGEPGLRWSRPYSAVPLLRVGGLHLAAVKLSGGNAGVRQGAEEDARAVWRWLDVMGETHRPLLRMFADNFRRMMALAGVTPSTPPRPPDPGEEDEEPKGNGYEAPGTFSGTVLAVERWTKPFVR